MKKDNQLIFARIFVVFLIGFLFLPLINAGVGIKWSKESALVPENTKVCMTYGIYNPWPEDSYAKIRLSEDIMKIVKTMDSEVQFIPLGTSSSEAIPVEFCFKTPKVYEQDCALANKFLCKQECSEETKVYEGEVEVIESSDPDDISGGSGGSSTTMSVSAPLRVRVDCVAHARNYSLIYILVAVVAGVLLTINLVKRKKSKKKK